MGYFFSSSFLSSLNFTSNQLGEVAGYLIRVEEPIDAFVGLGMVFRIEAGQLVHLGLGTRCGGF